MAGDHGAEQMSTAVARAREVDRLRQVAAKAEQARLKADFWREKDPARSALASGSFHRAMDEVYPASWRDTIEALQRGERGAVEPAIVFLEADPRFFRSGYMKEELCRFLGRAPLTLQQRNRLVSVAISAIDDGRRPGRERRAFARMLTRIDPPANAERVRKR